MKNGSLSSLVCGRRSKAAVVSSFAILRLSGLTQRTLLLRVSSPKTAINHYSLLEAEGRFGMLLGRTRRSLLPSSAHPRPLVRDPLAFAFSLAVSNAFAPITALGRFRLCSLEVGPCPSVLSRCRCSCVFLWCAVEFLSCSFGVYPVPFALLSPSL